MPPAIEAARGASPALFLAGLLLYGVAHAAEVPISPSRQSELVRLVRNDCGSCHGLSLKGGLGPALLPEALREKDPLSLSETILRGRAGTAMPPWSQFLQETEAKWIVEQLMKGFPDAR
jgi:cytochrome c55X